jgi:MoxR-like ATPase
MNSGDLCLFYTSDAALGRNQYNWLAKVSEIRRSPEISQAFWDTPEFEWVYFLDEPSKLNLSVEELACEVARFRPDYLSRAPMGIMSLDPEVLQGLLQAHGDIEPWLKSRFGPRSGVESDFLTIMRRYKDDHTVFCSSRRGMRYAIEAVDENGCTVKRLDANENTRCTTSLLAEKLQLVRSKGGIHPFDDSFASTSAIRNCLLQAKTFGLSADRDNIVDVSEPDRGLNLFYEILQHLRVDESSGKPKLYKPAMLACVLEGIRKRELTENKVSFDWIAPRFIEKMAGLGEQIGEREAAMPFFHLTGDLFWMLSYRNLTQLVSDGSEGPVALRAKVSHASIKDTFWDILQNSQYLKQAEEALATKWWPANRTPRFWVEKTLVNGHPDRTSGENALGLALWSPQRADGGRDIYWPMREVKPGDVVFHFIDDQLLNGYSVASSVADTSFVGVAGTKYEGRPAYRIPLDGHEPIEPPIDRKEFLAEPLYRPLIEKLLEDYKGLFFNREFNLNQGSYLTEAPLLLVQIWNDIHLRKTGKPLNPSWNIPQLEQPKSDELKRYWIFQANPNNFDVDSYLRDRNEIRWSIRQYEKLVHPGDEVLVWRAGPDGGVVAQCSVITEPDPTIKNDAPELWRGTNEGPPNEPRCKLHVVDKFTDQPISRQSVKTVLPELSIIRFAQNTNYPVSRAEFDTILRLRNATSLAMNFDAEKLSEAWNAIATTHLQIDRNFLDRFVISLASKPFVILTGNSGTGKTKLAYLFAHWLSGSFEESKNGYAVVPVGADWTDNRNILGFVNYLRKDIDGNPVYQATPVLDLLLRAQTEPNRPFFLVLDEMNLSHVERYFADFLSAMESQKPVPLHGEATALKTARGDMINQTISFPDNVFVVGTVNVDETTYMFSPKVLDRANVIEFRVSEQQATAFLTSGSSALTQIKPAPRGYGEAFLRLCRNARRTPASDLALTKEAKEPPEEFHKGLQECQRVLQDLLSILRINGQDFAYRTMAEALRYVHVDFELTEDDSWSWANCMDAQILQKILPKLHGSNRRIGSLLVALATYCEKADVEESRRFAREDKNPQNFKGDKDRAANPTFPLSYEKLCEMILAVRRDQFVSFIQ